MLPIDYVTVIYHGETWIVRVRVRSKLNAQHGADLRAFMLELGATYEASEPMVSALQALAKGQSIAKIIQAYQLSVISHGKPVAGAIEAFRDYFIEDLGYCPSTLA